MLRLGPAKAEARHRHPWAVVAAGQSLAVGCGKGRLCPRVQGDTDVLPGGQADLQLAECVPDAAMLEEEVAHN